MRARWIAVFAIAAVACTDTTEESVEPVAPIPTDPNPQTDPEQTSSASLKVKEAGIRTSYSGEGATVSIPIYTVDGVGKNALLAVSITPLDSLEGPSGTTTFKLEPGTNDVSVLVKGAGPPEGQGLQAGQLIRYGIAVAGADAEVYGMRSLYVTQPKLGLRVWAPKRVDAGAATRTRVWVRDLETDQLIPDREVTVNGAAMGTDPGGRAAFDLSAPVDGSEFAIEARTSIDGQPVVVKRPVTVVAPGAPVLFVSTDKPLYRPGQTIHIRALALAQKDLGPVADTPVTLEVLDGKQNKIFKEETVTDAYGIASLTAALASQVNVGNYVVRAVMSEVSTDRVVEVSEEKLPKFAVTVSFDELFFNPDEAITGVLKARYFFGKAVVDAEVTLQIGDVEVHGTTNGEGLMPFEIGGASFGPLAIVATVTDSAGFTVTKDSALQILPDALTVTLVPEGNNLPSPATWTVYVSVKDALGRPVAAECKSGDDSWAIDESGVGAIQVSAQKVSVTCTTTEGLTGTAARNLYLAAEGGGLLLRTDKAIYQPGDTVTVTLIGPPGVDKVYVDRVHRGRIVEGYNVALTNQQGTVAMTPDSSETGTLVLTGVYFDDQDNVVNAERMVYVQRPFASASVTTDQPQYLPGGEAELTFEITDEKGEPKPGALGVTIADEAVFALAGSVGPDDVKGFFLLDDVPAALNRYALAETPDDVQVPARAALASAPPASPTGIAGVTKASLKQDALNQYNPALRTIANGVKAELQELSADGKLDTSNFKAVLSGFVRYDVWGQKMKLTVTKLNEWGSVRFEATSRGMDEVWDTDDDWSRTMHVYVQSKDSGGGGDDGGAFGAADDDADGLNEPSPAPPADGEAQDESESAGVKKRQDFPETLYVNPALITGADGKATVTLPMADAITSWRVSMVANTAGGRVGGGKGEITVFQDFFVDTDLPRKLTQNDTLQLPIGVFNFSDVEQQVTVTVLDAEWFSLEGSPVSVVTVPAGKSAAVPFAITVLKAGHHELSVTAVSDSLTDGVVRTVQVLPDGQRNDGSKSGPLEADVTQTITMPEDAIEGGNDVFLKLMGGPGAQMVDGMDALLRSPRGCFEPMMNSTWINALVGDYMIWTGSGNAGLIAQAKAGLDDGYQQCATFECTGGGFTWFGDPDPAHPILTAFALIMFDDIAQLRDVDAGLIERAQTMLVNYQDESGSWSSEQGTKNEIVPWDELRSSCIAAWGLAASGGEADPLAKAMTYITTALDLEADTYTMAMCANALLSIAPGDPDTDAVVAELLDRVEAADGGNFWSSDYPGFTHAHGEVIKVETTALVAQALFRMESPPTVVQGALKYLAKQKSPDGNFKSTQGTIQALRAFVAAAKFAAGDTDAELTVKVGGKQVFTVGIDKTNREVVHLVSLTEHLQGNEPADVTIGYSGEGKLYYQLATRHYTPWDALTRRVGPLMDIGVSYSATELKVGQSTTATVTVTSSGPAEPGDMPMVNVGVPPGFDADLTALDELVANDINVARYELKGDRVVIYLHMLPDEPGVAFEVAIPLSPRFAMEVTTPAATAYPFYKPQEQSESLPVVLTVTGG